MSDEHSLGLNEQIKKGFQSLGIDNVKQQSKFENNKLPIALKDTHQSMEKLSIDTKDDDLVQKDHIKHKLPNQYRCNVDLKDTFLNKQHDNNDDENDDKIKCDIPKDDIDPGLMEIITTEKIFRGLMDEIRQRTTNNDGEMMECGNYSLGAANTSCLI